MKNIKEFLNRKADPERASQITVWMFLLYSFSMVVGGFTIGFLVRVAFEK